MFQIWDVLSNKEVVDIVSSSARSCASRTLVETAVRAWRSKYPTSKVDDCAVVCLFLDSDESTSSTTKTKDNIPDGAYGKGEEENGDISEAANEDDDEEVVKMEVGREWSALEGVSRVNTLVTLPRFVPGKEDIEAAEGKKKKWRMFEFLLSMVIIWKLFFHSFHQGKKK